MYHLSWMLYPEGETGSKMEACGLDLKTWPESKAVISMLECLEIPYNMSWDPDEEPLPGEGAEGCLS